MQNSTLRKYLILIFCGITGSAIYRLPFLRETYYEVMKQAIGVTNYELGMLMSAYGIVNFILYLPGGWIADKFSARNLMTFSLISTGVIGFYFATFPQFPIVVILHGFWAITTVFTFWSTCIRVIRQLGDSSEQGKLFGFWYLGQGLTSMTLSFITIPIFSYFGEGINGLKAIIIFYSIISIITGIFSWILMSNNKTTINNNENEEKFNFKDIFIVFKMPTVWLSGLASFCMWNIYISFGYMTPYLTDIFNLDISKVVFISTLRAYILFAIGGLISGKIADKCKTKSIFMVYLFIGMVIFSSIYIFIPNENNMLIFAILNMIGLGIFIYCANSVFFSLIDETNVPLHLTGTAAGIISLCAYLPDVYLYTTIGNILDKNPGIIGYKYIFIFIIVCAVVGIIASFILHKTNNNK